MAIPQPVNPPKEPRDGDRNTWWGAADLGYFDPNYNSKTIAAEKSIEHIGKDTIFRDVYLFIKRAKDIAAV